MTYEDFRRELFRLALENGGTAAETYNKEGEEFSVGILSQEIDSYSVSRTLGISLRVQKDGKDGYAYTECMENPAALVQRAIDNALAVETADEHPMQGPQVYPAVEQPEDPIAACPEAGRIELVEIDVGVGVESVENQFTIVGGQFSLGGHERCLIHPVLFVHPLHCALVEAEKRVLDDLVGHEVGVHCAWHGGRIPDFGTSLPELPSVVNVALRHGRIRGRCKHHCGQCR